MNLTDYRFRLFRLDPYRVWLHHPRKHREIDQKNILGLNVSQPRHALFDTQKFVDRVAMQLSKRISLKNPSARLYFTISAITRLVWPATPAGTPAVIMTMSETLSRSWRKNASIEDWTHSSVVAGNGRAIASTPQTTAI